MQERNIESFQLEFLFPSAEDFFGNQGIYRDFALSDLIIHCRQEEKGR